MSRHRRLRADFYTGTEPGRSCARVWRNFGRAIRVSQEPPLVDDGVAATRQFSPGSMTFDKHVELAAVLFDLQPGLVRPLLVVLVFLGRRSKMVPAEEGTCADVSQSVQTDLDHLQYRTKMGYTQLVTIDDVGLKVVQTGRCTTTRDDENLSSFDAHRSHWKAEMATQALRRILQQAHQKLLMACPMR